MTVCCQCGRHFWPGYRACPGRPAGPGRESKDCNHLPCPKCKRYEGEIVIDLSKIPEHVCGLQGFGNIEDTCPGCDRDRENNVRK